MKKNELKGIIKKSLITLGTALAITANGLILEGDIANAAIKTGWQQDSYGLWYYYYSDGSQAFGWLKDGDKWYYLDTCSGQMYTGTCRVNNKREVFDTSGKWLYTDEPTEQISSSVNLSKLTNSAVGTDAISLEEFTEIANEEMLRLVNEYRGQNGVKPLKWNKTLESSSKEKAVHMQKHNYMDHDYNGITTAWIQELKYKQEISGENALANYHYTKTKEQALKMARSMFNQWKESRGHARQMLKEDHKEMGFGFCISDGGTEYGSYAIQQFWDGSEYEEGSVRTRSLVDGSFITDDSPYNLKELL